MSEQRAIGINGTYTAYNVGNAWHFIFEIIISKQIDLAQLQPSNGWSLSRIDGWISGLPTYLPN